MIFKTIRLLVKNIEHTRRSHTATVFFFHGAGDSGPNLIEWIQDLLGRNMEFPHIKVIYPTAPLQRYTPNDGDLTNVWFNLSDVSIDAVVNLKSMSQTYKSVNEMIDMELASGITINRIIVGGFSLGGALALHVGYHLKPNLGGVFACSSFLNNDSIVYESLKNHRANLPELRMFHGDRDNVVPFEWGKITFSKLSQLGVNATFTELTNAEHELTKRELEDIQNWILKKLPPQ